MNRNRFFATGATALTFMLAACGGGGTNVATIPPPQPTPTPSPTPTPTPTPTPSPTPTPTPAYEPIKIFPGVTSTTDLAAVGIEANPYDEDGALNSVGFAVRYDANSGVYVMSVPTAQHGEFYSEPSSNGYWDGELRNSSSDEAVKISVLKPGNSDQQFTYSSLAFYFTFAAWPGNYGWLAFGTPTQPNAVPATGSATYSALVRGSPGWGDAEIRGTATLNFDFGAGQLSGHFDPQYILVAAPDNPLALGRYDFANTVFGVGSTSFSGEIANPAFGHNGSFKGSFTGPNAEELISTWTAPFHNPTTGQDSLGFGVWVGKRP